MTTTTLERPVAAKPASIRDTLKGILPPFTMPFDQRGEIVFSAIKEQVDFAVGKGVNGIVVGGSTGEGHTLGAGEFIKVMEASHEALAGRRPLIAGLIVNSTREAIERVKALDGMDIAALQITPVHYLFKPSAQNTVEHFRAIHEATGIPILIYNVIPWNYLSVDLMLQVMKEVPGVVGMKQSSGDLKSVSDLMGSVSDQNVVLSGIDALLYPSFALGAHGAISALTAAVPGVTVKLWNAVQSKDFDTALRIHNALNQLWNVLKHDNLPACVKYIQHRQGLGFFYARAPMDQVSDEQKAAINPALDRVLAL
ncbi:4-hydroxy-tetrahydrodipicolinate synthase [Faunimonas pinastri]|uniref:4-hydroxy-tetrahydrodipicolinate synthase n=1 Tax=Faunimonas pinastri TaxID=1855383 RepID=A0A1H9EET7_9HYPH|nr:dihydrodipicolinate synthase family protein [Faunimonas pinastri]SEQ24159.1 4-hydroxy-tetrahydrodipicolinate synthase [Faunimonas pinastri]